MNKLCAYLDVFEQRNLSVNVFPLYVVWVIFFGADMWNFFMNLYEKLGLWIFE